MAKGIGRRLVSFNVKDLTTDNDATNITAVKQLHQVMLTGSDTPLYVLTRQTPGTFLLSYILC